ncbi:hypothetical protein Zmor_016608 [Zophobas morio]|uniref:Uncharacterized protein n=1 Tax=Zophobas morio TaxID=2755281 RepID=A0AA38I7N1_9CUCU|nr:hypothetical protein Zmor_016608 [Zophobas morio]
MKAIVALLFTIGIVEVSYGVRVCNITCEPKDEFLGEETTEWNDFMNDLVFNTFQPRTLPCRNSDGMATIDYNSDLIWDLRFRIYSSRANEQKKTLNDCYCDITDCESVELRQCLAEVRTEMKAEVMSVMAVEVGVALLQLSSTC